MDSYKRAENLLARARKLGLINPVTDEGSPTVDMIAEEIAYAEADAEPLTEDPSEIEELVVGQIRSRRDAGRVKYKTTMERKDLTFLQWIQHLQEELLDAAIYAEKLKQEFIARKETK